MKARRPSFSRRSFASGAAGALLLDLADASEPSLAFLVIGDWGRNSPEQRLVAASMAAAAAANQPAFIISTGDNFYDDGVTSTSDPKWRSTFEDVYTAPSLQVPWFAVLGNHDHRGSIAAQIAYSALSPRWRMRGRYWREDMRIGAASVSFFLLDTTLLTRLPLSGDTLGHSAALAQLRWLERGLAVCTSTWKFVIGHHPILSGGDHGPSPALDRFVRPLLERRGVSAYFNGHDHNLEHLESGGVHYVCSGAGARPRGLSSTPDTRFGCAELGFAACALSPRDLSIAFHDARAEMRYRAVIEPARSALLAAGAGP